MICVQDPLRRASTSLQHQDHLGGRPKRTAGALPPCLRLTELVPRHPYQDNSSTMEGGLDFSVETWLSPCLQDAKMARHSTLYTI